MPENTLKQSKQTITANFKRVESVQVVNNANSNGSIS